MFAHDVLKTIYSPVKAFEEIVKKPDIKGPFLILVLTLIITASLQYVVASKVSVGISKPERDEWTESKNLWTSNGTPSNSNDTVVGNYSVMSSVADKPYIWMKLTGIGAINCSGNENYKRLSFRIKWTHQNGVPPDSEATLKLSSNDEDGYLKLDLSEKISNSSGKWHNSTVDVGPESQGWNHTDSTNWENITGLEFRLAWLASANLTMQIDDLHFRRYVPSMTAFSLEGWLINSLTSIGLGFLVSWGVYGGLLMLVVKVFGEEVGSWKSLFVVVGYLFSVRVVHLVVSVVLVPMLPEVRLENLAQIWTSTLPYQMIHYFSLVTGVWMAALCAIAVRFFYTFTWKKAIGISVLASLLNFTLRFFIPI